MKDQLLQKVSVKSAALGGVLLPIGWLINFNTPHIIGEYTLLIAHLALVFGSAMFLSKLGENSKVGVVAYYFTIIGNVLIIPLICFGIGITLVLSADKMAILENAMGAQTAGMAVGPILFLIGYLIYAAQLIQTGNNGIGTVLLLGNVILFVGVASSVNIAAVVGALLFGGVHVWAMIVSSKEVVENFENAKENVEIV